VVFPEISSMVVTSEPFGINCSYLTGSSSCRLLVDTNSEVVLTSTVPNVYWLNCDTPPNGTTKSTTCRVSMTKNRTVNVQSRPFSDSTESLRRNAGAGTGRRR
jgi:hypothetical protein